MAATVQEVARWMAREVHGEGVLYHQQAAAQIVERFGEEFVAGAENGHGAIRRDVLDAFDVLTPGVVWARTGRYWRIRLPDDPAGRDVSE